jgi:hypothetical protein
MLTREGTKATPADRERNYHALVRDVILGTLAVIFVSLAVPAWILRAEYRKTYSAPVALVPAAEVLRERMSPVVVPPRPPKILELAERLVRQEAERRAAERRAAAHAPSRVPLPPPVARPVTVDPPAVTSPSVVAPSPSWSPLPIELQQSP